MTFEFEIDELVIVREKHQVHKIFGRSVLPNGNKEYLTKRVGAIGCYGDGEFYLENEIYIPWRRTALMYSKLLLKRGKW